MIAALTWIKLIGISVLLSAVVGLWLKLDVAQAKNRNLVSKLEIAADTNRTDRAMIAILKNDNSKINSLLVKRQQENIQQKEKLNADIKHLNLSLKQLIVIVCLGLILLLTGCANHTEIIKTEVVKILPPSGLVVPCHKPLVVGKCPTETVEDILRLKSALSQCSTQADDYLRWRKVIEEGG